MTHCSHVTPPGSRFCGGLAGWEVLNQTSRGTFTPGSPFLPQILLTSRRN